MSELYQCYKQDKQNFGVIFIFALSYDVASGSEIMPCNKIDKPLVVYRFYEKRYDVHNNVVYILTHL